MGCIGGRALETPSQPSLLIPHKEMGAGQVTQSDQLCVPDVTHQITVPRSTSHCKNPFLQWGTAHGLPRLLNLIICEEGQSLAAGQGRPSRSR